MTAGMASDNKQTKHHHAPATEYYPFKTSVLTSFMQTDNTLPGEKTATGTVGRQTRREALAAQVTKELEATLDEK